MKTTSLRRCPLAGPGAKMTRAAFVKCCLHERGQRSVSLTAVKIKYVCDDCITGNQVEYLVKKRRDREIQLQDGDVSAEFLIMEELAITPPDGIEFFELDVLKTEREKAMKKTDDIPAGNWRQMGFEAANRILPTDLIKWWKTPALKSGMKGTCPNCQRPDMRLASYGICGGCREVSKNKRGFALLTALAAQGKRLHEQYMQTSIAGQKIDEKEVCDMPVAVEKKEVEKKIEEWRPEEITGGTKLTAVQQSIIAETDSLREMLLAKNKAYGNSAIEPVRIFSTCDPLEQINVRLDDKLSRLMRGSQAGEDVELDLMGYLVLRRVARKMQDKGKN